MLSRIAVLKGGGAERGEEGGCLNLTCGRSHFHVHIASVNAVVLLQSFKGSNRSHTSQLTSSNTSCVSLYSTVVQGASRPVADPAATARHPGGHVETGGGLWSLHHPQSGGQGRRQQGQGRDGDNEVNAGGDHDDDYDDGGGHGGG